MGRKNNLSSRKGLSQKSGGKEKAGRLGGTEKKKPGYEELLAKNRELEERLKGIKDQSNREYKSRLFGFLFGREEHKEWTLALYNAVNGSAHTNSEDITINTIEDVVYLGMKNDLSLLVSENVRLYQTQELYEQQSSFNPNMPVREFMYAGKLYDKFLYAVKRNRYGRTLIPLPIPKLVVFYNGRDDREDEVILSLSDAFKEEIRRSLRAKDAQITREQLEEQTEQLLKDADPDIEVRVRMININYGHNKDMMKVCKPLEEYSWFVEKIREINKPDTEGKRCGAEAAIDKAIDQMPKDFLIREFVVTHRAEVKDMCLTEYNEAEVMEMFREEGREEGRELGEKRGAIMILGELVRDGVISLKEGALRVHMSEGEFEENLKRMYSETV